jgi:nucleoside 2-deoxyribosyltransferase
MRAYISVSFSNRKLIDGEIIAINETLDKFKITPFVFVDRYTFSPSQEKQMMDQAMADIDHCDILIAETSHKAIGVGVEAGYARAKGKPVIYLRRIDAEHSSTVSGISNFKIIYSDTADLQKQLSAILTQVFAH